MFEVSCPSAPLVKIDEAAEFLCVSPRTIVRLVAAGKIPAVKISARCIRFDLEDLRAFAQSRKGVEAS